MTATARQIALIHILAAKAGMDDDIYRDFLFRATGARSAKALTAAQAAAVIERLKVITGQAAMPGAISGLDTPVAKKLRALWIAAWNLGLARDRSDRAMLSFLERQTGVSHVRFLKHPSDATAAIEALKSWLKRAGGVDWPRNGDTLAAKRAVLAAQWMRLIAAGAVTPFVAHRPLSNLDDYAYRIAGRNGWCFFDGHHYDAVQAALGRKLRAALARLPAGHPAFDQFDQEDAHV